MMVPPLETDDLLSLLRSLPRHDMADTRVRRTRDRAHAALARRPDPHRQALASLFRRFVEPPLVLGLSLGYLAWAISCSVAVLRAARGGLL